MGWLKDRLADKGDTEFEVPEAWISRDLLYSFYYDIKHSFKGLGADFKEAIELHPRSQEEVKKLTRRLAEAGRTIAVVYCDHRTEKRPCRERS